MKVTSTTIPKYILNKMHRLAKLSAEAKTLDAEISEWFEAQGYETEAFCFPSLRNDDGLSLSELSDGNDITEEFRVSFETGCMNKCLKENN